jgi:hypothetical protein
MRGLGDAFISRFTGLNTSAASHASPYPLFTETIKTQLPTFNVQGERPHSKLRFNIKSQFGSGSGRVKNMASHPSKEPSGFRLARTLAPPFCFSPCGGETRTEDDAVQGFAGTALI